MRKSIPELDHLSVVYQLKSNILLGVNNLGGLSSRLEVVIVAYQQKKTKTKTKPLTMVLIGENQLSYKS